MSEVSKINKLALRFQSTGSEQSFNKIYNELFQPILNFVRKFLLNFFKYNPGVAYREAPDITNETFIKVYKKIHQFKPKYQFTTWIYTIAKNLSLQKIKKYQREKLVPFDFNVPALTEEGNESAFSFDTDVKLWKTEEYEFDDLENEHIFKQILKKGFKEVDPDLQDILTDREFKEMKYKHIADKYDLNINTVKTKIRRGREQLQIACDEIKRDYVSSGKIDENEKYTKF